MVAVGLVSVAIAIAVVEEDGLVRVDLGRLTALAVLVLPAVVAEPPRGVEPIALLDVLGDRLGGLAPGPEPGAVPFLVWRNSGSVPTRPSSSIRLIVRDIGGAPFRERGGAGTPTPVE